MKKGQKILLGAVLAAMGLTVWYIWIVLVWFASLP